MLGQSVCGSLYMLANIKTVTFDEDYIGRELNWSANKQLDVAGKTKVAHAGSLLKCVSYKC